MVVKNMSIFFSGVVVGIKTCIFANVFLFGHKNLKGKINESHETSMEK